MTSQPISLPPLCLGDAGDGGGHGEDEGGDGGGLTLDWLCLALTED